MVGAVASLTSNSQPETPRLEPRVEEIYAEHVTMVWRSLRRLGVPEASIEDAVQDVFLVVHRRLSEFAGRSAMKTWLYGIVLRVAKDHRRAQIRQAHKVERLAQLLSSDASNGSTPMDAAERREANRALHAILATMADEQREVLVLVEMEELSVREAASALQLHVRTCQRRLRAAHVSLEEKVAHCLQLEGRPNP
jgi:RNA polymerase sigma-70 factor, ECF subfamily